MTLKFYALNFVGSSVGCCLFMKYVLKVEPNLGVLIGVSIGIGISALIFGVK